MPYTDIHESRTPIHRQKNFFFKLKGSEEDGRHHERSSGPLEAEGDIKDMVKGRS